MDNLKRQLKRNNLELRNWSDELSKIVCNWKYSYPYNIYNLPSFDEMKMRSIGFANKNKIKNFKAVFLQNKLIGFFNLVNGEKEVFLGVGICTDLCSKGYGYKLMLSAIAESEHLYGSKTIYLDVRDWNTRAINCYLKAGFKIYDNIKLETYIGEGNFIRMKYKFT